MFPTWHSASLPAGLLACCALTGGLAGRSDVVAAAGGAVPPQGPLGGLLQDALDLALALLDGLLCGALNVQVDLALPLRQAAARRLVEALGGDRSPRALVQVGYRVPVRNLQQYARPSG